MRSPVAEPVRVVTAREAADRDASVIGAGTPSRTLMQRAGAAAASEIALRYAERLSRGVLVYAGPGNNGGDAYVVARALAAAGVPVRVIVAAEPRTADAQAERTLLPAEVNTDESAGPSLVVDGLLGTGASGEPRGAIAEAIQRVNGARNAGAVVVALDVPSGLDATTGQSTLAVSADLTLTFGTVKRGLLVDRARAGRIVVLDIGLGTGDAPVAPALVDGRWVRTAVPAIAATSHKGTRRRLVIVGGSLGMAGASVLAARAAARSGIGMVRLVVARDTLPVVQAAAHHAMARTWDEVEGEGIAEAITDWAHAVLLGPGLGNTPRTRALVERILRAWRGPVVLDADALNVFTGEAELLGSLLDGRPALITPHPAEFARLSNVEMQAVIACQFDIGRELAHRVRATVLLKGVPTVITDVEGTRMVSASGTPVLAAAGSGDLLAGIAGTLLAQTENALHAGACAAWVHGRAAELAAAGRSIRGVTLDDVEDALPRAWSEPDAPIRYPVLAELPSVV